MHKEDRCIRLTRNPGTKKSSGFQ